MLQIIGKGGFGREVAAYAMSVTKSFEGDLAGLDPKEETVIAIGSGQVRKDIAESRTDIYFGILNEGTCYELPTYGPGAIICPGTIITTGVDLGKHVLINLNCTIGHDTDIGDYTTISPGVNISGNVKIGKLCYIGSNVVIREKVQICDNVIVGAGAVVVKDITEAGTYVGNPARKLS